MSWRALRPLLRKVAGSSRQTQKLIGHGLKVRDFHSTGPAVFNYSLAAQQRYNYSVPVLQRLSTYNASSMMHKAAFATSSKEDPKKGLATQDEDPFDPLTDRIPEKPVSVAEGASYGLVILAGLAVAAGAAYAVCKELIFEPKEYKIFGMALDRVQHDSQVTSSLGSPITGYGQETRNRAARQRISHKVWKDEDGVERVEVVFLIRGPHGAGKAYAEMFKDKLDRTWKFTYLIVDVLGPRPARLMLESYVPA